MLPSKGMVMIKGLIKDKPFEVTLEPGGKGSHWFEIIDKMISEQNLKVADSVNMNIVSL